MLTLILALIAMAIGLGGIVAILFLILALVGIIE